MITLQIRYLSWTDHKPTRWKVIDGQSSLIVGANSHTYQQAATIFINKYWPDCQILNFGQLPNGDMIALAATGKARYPMEANQLQEALT
tara:strand:+ start:394 stop:660 length:267 start_codon:yes stop_codon:yes gene_type:complete